MVSAWRLMASLMAVSVAGLCAKPVVANPTKSIKPMEREADLVMDWLLVQKSKVKAQRAKFSFVTDPFLPSEHYDLRLHVYGPGLYGRGVFIPDGADNTTSFCEMATTMYGSPSIMMGGAPTRILFQVRLSRGYL